MEGKWKIIAAVTLIVTVFLLGFVPQYLHKRNLGTELSETQFKLSSARQQIQIDEVRTLAARVLLQASRQNYGTARETATALFNKVRELAEESDNPSLKTSLLQILNLRDSITSGLTQATPSIIPELQSLLEGTFNLPDAGSAVR